MYVCMYIYSIIAMHYLGYGPYKALTKYFLLLICLLQFRSQL